MLRTGIFRQTRRIRDYLRERLLIEWKELGEAGDSPCDKVRSGHRSSAGIRNNQSGRVR